MTIEKNYANSGRTKQINWRKSEMTSLPVEIEIDRLMNLIRGFGWEETEKKISGSEIRITIRKKIIQEVPSVS